MNTISIKQIIPAQKVNMGGHIIDQPLPMQAVEQIDPFLLIHHWKSHQKNDTNHKESGVGPHPHRGFSPVTFVYKGEVHHRDTLGNSQVIKEGGTQWINAGRGLHHSERPSKEFAKRGGETEFIQFWINSPAKNKMDSPYYLPLTNEQTPKIIRDGIEIAVVAGSFENTTGPATIHSPMILLRIEAKIDSIISLPIPKRFNTLIYVLHGKIISSGIAGTSKDMLWYNNDGENIELEIKASTRFIVLSGEPLNEPLATYGPFVMNTETEIMEAIRDAQMGKMGVLIEEF